MKPIRNDSAPTYGNAPEGRVSQAFRATFLNHMSDMHRYVANNDNPHDLRVATVSKLLGLDADTVTRTRPCPMTSRVLYFMAVTYRRQVMQAIPNEAEALTNTLLHEYTGTYRRDPHAGVIDDVWRENAALALMLGRWDIRNDSTSSVHELIAHDLDDYDIFVDEEHAIAPMTARLLSFLTFYLRRDLVDARGLTHSQDHRLLVETAESVFDIGDVRLTAGPELA